MKKSILNLLILLFIPITLGAQIYVPYRKGNKFGISDENGKILLTPNFDKIKILTDSTFIGFIINGDNFNSSFINKNKVIILNKDFLTFSETEGLILGTRSKSAYRDYRNIEEEIFSMHGNSILGKPYENITVLNYFRNPNTLLKNKALISVADKNTKSLFLYDLIKNEIVKKYYENVRVIDSELNKQTNSFNSKYIENRQGKMLTINFKNREILNDEVISISIQNPKNSYNYNNEIPSPSAIQQSREDLSQSKEIQQGFMRYYKLKENPDPQNLEHLEFDKTEINSSLTQINGKWGLKDLKTENWILEPVYDEIILFNTPSPFSYFYAILQNKKYGLYYYHNKEDSKIIKPIFNNIPYIHTFDYGKKGFHLIKLFDEKGNLICFANNKGKLYYTK